MAWARAASLRGMVRSQGQRAKGKGHDGAGYNVPDVNRQKYAMLERDSTGLDYTWWRKYEIGAWRLGSFH